MTDAPKSVTAALATVENGEDGRDGPTVNGANGRDPVTGRFVRGCAGGPGDPLSAATCRFRVILAGAATPDEQRQIARNLVEQALAGERWAIVEYLDRIIGRPAQSVELTGADGDPLAIKAAVWTIRAALGMADKTGGAP